jgi:hypothetical protein
MKVKCEVLGSIDSTMYFSFLVSDFTCKHEEEAIFG